jgi:hypothetical protein
VADVDDFIDGEGDLDVFDPVVANAAAKEQETAKATTDALLAAHIKRTKQAYIAVFEAGNPTRGDIEFVMQDLFWFVKGDVHFFNDARLQDVMAGRKQVLQRITEYTKFDFDTLHRMYATAQK